MAFEGMDVDGARQVANYIQNRATQDMQNTLNQINSQITSIQWTGTDQTTFVNNWQSTMSQLQNQIQTALSDTVNHLNQEISQQDTASAT
jgi:peptidoglycan hydrolase CwlO-like protein